MKYLYRLFFILFIFTFTSIVALEKQSLVLFHGGIGFSPFITGIKGYGESENGTKACLVSVVREYAMA